MNTLRDAPRSLLAVATYGLFCLLPALPLAGCAPQYSKPTAYAEANPGWGSPYGYKVKQLEKDEFSVFVTGNPKTSRERVAEIALLRAAELTREQGRTHFLIIKQISEVSSTHQPTYLPLGGLLVWVPTGETPSSEPTALILIRILSSAGPYPPEAIEAESVIDRLADKLKK
ncbi:MAG: hypothetical protein Q9M29_02930 [Mariprofundaceae bacterium]|nr:hypothetical protein [Mariprofundaceae bacterium]